MLWSPESARGGKPLPTLLREAGWFVTNAAGLEGSPPSVEPSIATGLPVTRSVFCPDFRTRASANVSIFTIAGWTAARCSSRMRLPDRARRPTPNWLGRPRSRKRYVDWRPNPDPHRGEDGEFMRRLPAATGNLALDFCAPEEKTGGEGGIRTPGSLRNTRFPSVRIRPLCHLSGVEPAPHWKSRSLSEGRSNVTRWRWSTVNPGAQKSAPRVRR